MTGSEKKRFWDWLRIEDGGYAPLVLTGGFFAFTVLWTVIGPIDWHWRNPQITYAFLAFCIAALVIGYILSGRVKNKGAYRVYNLNAYLVFAAVISIALYFPTCYANTGKWYPDVFTGLTNTGYAYQVSKYYSEFGPKTVFYIRILLSPITMMVMPLTIFAYSELKISGKILGILVIIMNILLSIAEGINNQIAMTVMQLVLALAILMFRGKGRNVGKKENAVYRVKCLLLIFACVILFMLYYANTMRNRVTTDIIMDENQFAEEGVIGENDVNADNSNGKNEEESSAKLEQLEELLADPENVENTTVDNAVARNSYFGYGTDRETYHLDEVLPGKINSAINYLTGYFCHGYFGLSLAMGMDFDTSYGLGFSDFVRHNFMKVIGRSEMEKAVFAKTYMGKLTNEGWQTGLVWPSFFVYPASDIGFVGTVLLVVLIGFLLGLSWRDVSKGNPFAIVSFVGFSTMIFYFSANNQMFQTGENCVGFIAALLCWGVSRCWGKVKIKK